MIKKLKKFNPYSHFNKIPVIGFAAAFAAVGATIIFFSYAATPVNGIQIDNATCTINNEQLNSSPTATWSNFPTFLLNGDGAGSTYSISLDNQPIGTYTAGSNGNVCIYDPSYATGVWLTNDSHTVTGQEISPHASTLSTFTFTVNNTNAAELATGAAGVGARSATAPACLNDDQIGSTKTASWTATPSFYIWGDGGLASYKFFVDGQSIGTASSDGYGNVCITDTTALNNGLHTLTAQEITPKSSSTLNPFTFTVDTTPPPTLATPTLDSSTDTGVTGDNMTIDTAVTIDGTAPAGAKVAVSDTNNPSYSVFVFANSSGKWSSGMPSAVGVHNFIAITYNEAGVASLPSSPLTVTVVAPVHPTVSVTSPSSNAVVSNPPTFTVNAAGSTYPIWEVQYSIDGYVVGTASKSPFSYTWSPHNQNGLHNVTATAIDTVGDATTSAPVSFTYDNTPSVPGTPTTTTPTTNNSPTWTWTPSTDLNGPGLGSSNAYTLQLAQDPTFSTGFINTTTTSTNSFATLNLTDGTWYMRVLATDLNGASSAYSNVGSVVVQPLSTPSITLNTPTNGATVSGTLPITSTVSDTNGANIEVVKLFIDGTFINFNTSSPYNINWDSTTVPNGVHNILVQAVDSNSNYVSAQASVTVANGVVTVPPPVTGVQVTAPSYNQVDVSWSPDTDNAVTGYYVLRSSPGSNYTNLTPAGINTLQYQDNSVSANNLYSYEIVAFAGVGNQSNASTAVSVTTPSNPDSTAPNPPTVVTVTPVSSSELSLTWTASSSTDVVGYEVFRGLSPTTIIGPISGNSLVTMASLPYGDSSGLSPSTTYYYYVEAINSSGLPSTPSGIASNTTDPPPPPTTTTVKGTVTSVNKKKVSTPLYDVLVKTNASGAGGTTTADTNPSGQYILPNIVSNKPHTYTFTLKGYKTINVKKVSYPPGTALLNEVMKK